MNFPWSINMAMWKKKVISCALTKSRTLIVMQKIQQKLLAKSLDSTLQLYKFILAKPNQKLMIFSLLLITQDVRKEDDNDCLTEANANGNKKKGLHLALAPSAKLNKRTNEALQLQRNL
ncbi:hypothetical protein Tco_1252221 [Tanacetum coccineum]